MSYVSDYKSICKVIFVACISWTFGIVEAVILSENTGARNECGPKIWSCILTCCIVHFISGVVSLHGGLVEIATNVDSDDEERKNKPSRYTVCLGCISMGVCIWAMVCYYGSGADCNTVFNNDYKDLWNIVFMECILFYIYLGLMTSACCCGCLAAIVGPIE